MALEDQLLELAKKSGADGAGIVPVADIVFHREFRADCEKNTCGHYGKSWTCPPHVGEIDELIARAQKCEGACVFCSVGKIGRPRDGDFIVQLGLRHHETTQSLTRAAKPLVSSLLPLGAGYCLGCSSCAILEDAPCRKPDEATASLESYGIAVTPLAKSAGLAYNAGRGTVTFFGAMLYRP